MADNVMTPEFRVSYPFVFRPNKPMDDKGTPKFSVTMLFPKGADLSKLKKAAEQAAIDKWGKDKIPKNLRTPFRDQGEKESEGYEAGAVFVTATSKQKPGLVDSQTNDIIDETQFYAGCYARATVRAFAYDTAGNKGVAFGLQNVQKLRDGESLSGRLKPQDEFEPVADADAADTAGAAGAAGLFG